MIDPERHEALRHEISRRIEIDRAILDTLRAEIAPLRDSVRPIQPRSTTSISVVGTDGGNNSVEFDPFLVELIRVVDSSNNEYCLEAVTPNTDVTALGEAQFNPDGTPHSALGELMADLDRVTGQSIRALPRLSHMIRQSGADTPTSPTWVKVYRELTEWAILYSILKNKDFGTDTLVVFDGLLRSKVFAGELFASYRRLVEDAIAAQWAKSRRRIYLVGVAKHSKVVSRYRLAMTLEGVLTCAYPAYIEVPRAVEQKAYVWSEYARGDDVPIEGEPNKFVAGKMFLVKFGPMPRDPIWPVDIFLPQSGQAPTIIGHLQADAVDGFPVPLYPRCLQRAHEFAALVDFDMDVLQEDIYAGVRAVLDDPGVLDIFRLQATDLSQRRYR